MKDKEMISITTVAKRLIKNCPHIIKCPLSGRIEDVIKHGGYREICLECWKQAIRSWKDE